jgi:CheY-like chemotaxis protein
MAGARILIIDDEENIRETMQFALDAVGYQTEVAADGPEGLEKFGTGESWDLVLLDQRMPGMEGLEVLRNIRERDPAARVLMVTAYGTIELAVDAMKSGAVDFLRKPFTPDVLRGAVQAALSHPRQPIDTAELTLPRLLPPEPRAALPLITFRTLNGYKHWDAPLPPGEEESAALRVRRGFEVKAPSGETQRCVVELTTCVRELIREETGRDYPPTDELWDTVCRMALADYLWTRAQLPPETLAIYELSRKQLEVVRSLAGLGPTVRR